MCALERQEGNSVYQITSANGRFWIASDSIGTLAMRRAHYRQHLTGPRLDSVMPRGRKRGR